MRNRLPLQVYCVTKHLDIASLQDSAPIEFEADEKERWSSVGLTTTGESTASLPT